MIMQDLGFNFIDSHIHQWDPLNTPHSARMAVKVFGRYPAVLDKVIRLVKPKELIESLGQTVYVTSPYLPQNYQQDLGPYQAEQVVHIEAHWHDDRGKGVVGETRFIESLPFDTTRTQLGAIVATADPRQSNFKKILKLHAKNSSRLRGIRRMGAVHEDKGILAWADQPHLYTDKKFLKGFEQLAQHQLSFDAWVYSTQLQDLIQLARQFPETSIVLDHLGTPAGIFGKVGKNTGLTQTGRDNIFYQWQEDIAELATCPNVYTKMSGLMMPVLGHQFHKNKRLATKQQMIDLLSPMILHALKSFGTYRVMFGSNFPMDKVSTSLVNLIDAYSDIVASYNASALKNIFYDNARQFYRL